MNHSPVLVLGASGKTGRRVADRLEAGGIAVRRASRTSPCRFAWEDESTWDAALRGVDAMYVTYFPDLAAPSAAELLGQFGQRAAGHGVATAVLLSGRGEPESITTEEAFSQHVAATTVVRCAWFVQNFTEGMAAPAVAEGVLRLPAPATAREPFVDADDIADCVVALLRTPSPDARLFEVTGPTALTMTDVAAILTRVSGRPVVYEPVTADEFAADLLADTPGMDPDEALGVALALAATFDGRNQHTTDDVTTILGRPPRSFAQAAAVLAGLLPVGGPR
jgi:uncharacterized protein YbjT (DUF2867 family)